MTKHPFFMTPESVNLVRSLAARQRARNNSLRELRAALPALMTAAEAEHERQHEEYVRGEMASANSHDFDEGVL